MPVSRSAPPKHSWSKLSSALKTVDNLKAQHSRWMSFSASALTRDRVFYANLVYNIRLDAFLGGKRLSSSLNKVAWMYFLRDHGNRLACAEVSMVSGKHKHPRLSEGPFVKKAFRSIEKSSHDPRIKRYRYALRYLRLESMHVFCLWIKADRRVEYFIPVASSNSVLKAGQWFSRKELTNILRSEGRRVRAAQERMSDLLKERHV